MTAHAPRHIMLFVYGSLLRGEPNHALLAGACLLGAGETPPHYTLLDLGDYPALAPGGETAVVGEVYEVPPELLPELDRLEEHPHVYVRQDLTLADGRLVQTYLLHERLRSRYRALPGGDWRTLRAPRSPH